MYTQANMKSTSNTLDKSWRAWAQAYHLPETHLRNPEGTRALSLRRSKEVHASVGTTERDPLVAAVPTLPYRPSDNLNTQMGFQLGNSESTDVTTPKSHNNLPRFRFGSAGSLEPQDSPSQETDEICSHKHLQGTDRVPSGLTEDIHLLRGIDVA